MSVFDLPRLHFAGTATTKLPTGPRNGLVDLTTHSVVMDGERFPPERPVAEYHAYLDRVGGKGDAFGGNGYFALDAAVTAVELGAGEVVTDDPVTGRAVDVWGHYNPYLATTFNRARIFDVDPASNWTSTIMVGQFGFGRLHRSHDVEYMFTGGVHGTQPPRWHEDGRVLHQFVVCGGDETTWLDSAADSPAVARLRELVETGAADGLVVQLALSDAAPAPIPDTRQWRVRGTIAPWHEDEPRTCPAGRLLTPHNLTVDVHDHVTLNLVSFRPPDGTTGLELRTADSDTLVARVPGDSPHGVVAVPLVARCGAEALCLVGTNEAGERVVVAREREVTVLADDASLFLEHPRDAADDEQDVEVTVRTFVRGVPTGVPSVHIRQFSNPRACPLDERATEPSARPEDVDVVLLSADGTRWSRDCVLGTDEHGRGRFVVRGAKAGAARLLLTPDRATPLDGLGAAAAYDNDDALGVWSAHGSVAVRVLPDHWRLDDVPQDEVTFDLLYREVFAFYELLYSFMGDEVFSLADRFRIETHPRLIWQMCDPRNRAKTYYMPPTRDLTGPQARLLLKYLRARHSEVTAPTIEPSLARSGKPISTRTELVHALRHGVTIELAVMLQYLYAAFSIPTYGAGQQLVRRGDWTPEQLRLMCGDGGETADGGVRGALLGVAREEMIHFLVVNNVLVAIGEPFHLPDIDFGTINDNLMVPLDFSLEALGLGSVQRFIQIEQPDGLVGAVRLGDLPAPVESEQDYDYASLSELYGDIREGLRRVPGLFLVDKGRGGGEHHLFLRESINTRHPDYQLEVDDLSSALFAIDVVTEQGEGGVLTDADSDEESHYDTFVRVAELLMRERLAAAEKGRVRWSPAYPVARNPTLRADRQAMELVTDPVARTLMTLFNKSYFMMLQLMVQHFGGSPDASLRRSKLMNSAIDVMTGVMRPLAELLVTVPSGRHGRTAGPSFELGEKPAYISRPDVARRSISLRFRHLAEAARKCTLVPDKVVGNLEFLADQFATKGP
nr:RebD-like chromopyrrolic acid synthase [uncultured bacterium]